MKIICNVELTLSKKEIQTLEAARDLLSDITDQIQTKAADIDHFFILDAAATIDQLLDISKEEED